MDFPIKISEKAMQELVHIYLHKLPDTSMGLRIGVESSGCSGTRYLLGFDYATADDNRYQYAQLPVFISKKHLMFVLGVTIDFIDTAEVRGFTFIL